MVVHYCVECGALSINRVAADDTAGSLLDVLVASKKISPVLHHQMIASDIQPLASSETPVLQAQLERITGIE